LAARERPHHCAQRIVTADGKEDQRGRFQDDIGRSLQPICGRISITSIGRERLSICNGEELALAALFGYGLMNTWQARSPS
jgi:hypothetical protein